MSFNAKISNIELTPPYLKVFNALPETDISKTLLLSSIDGSKSNMLTCINQCECSAAVAHRILNDEIGSQ